MNYSQVDCPTPRDKIWQTVCYHLPKKQGWGTPLEKSHPRTEKDTQARQVDDKLEQKDGKEKEERHPCHFSFSRGRVEGFVGEDELFIKCRETRLYRTRMFRELGFNEQNEKEKWLV